jgi:hypothetical protein
MSAIQGDWYASRSTHNGEAYPQDDDTVRFVYATQADGTKFIVAKVWSGDDGDYSGTAKLVAAAPDLLAALKLCVELETNCDGRVICFCDDPEIAKHGKCYMCVACDAIAKAEGRTDD